MDTCIYDRLNPCDHSCYNCVQSEKGNEYNYADNLYKSKCEENILKKYEENRGNNN